MKSSPTRPGWPAFSPSGYTLEACQVCRVTRKVRLKPGTRVNLPLGGSTRVNYICDDCAREYAANHEPDPR